MLKLGRYWPWKTVWSHFHLPVRSMLLQRALVSVRLFCKNLGNLQKFFGQMVHRPLPPPPLQKIARTSMITANLCSSMLHKKTKENVLKIFCLLFFFRTWIALDSEPVSRNYTRIDMTPCPSAMPCSQVCNTTEFIYEVVFSKWKTKHYLLPDSSGNTLEMP